MEHEHEGRHHWRSYARFGAMIATSTLVMFLLTYTNVFAFAHIHFSQERLYMALLMGSAMAIVMLGYMWRMYPSRLVNIGIIAGALVVGGLAFTSSQQQWLIQDQAYMRAMIPHHSIAILTSDRSALADLRVQDLAEAISDTQVEEIAEMEWLLADIAANGAATTPDQAKSRPVPSFSGSAGGE